MICKKCGCDTLISDGDLLVCPLCGSRYYDTGIDIENSITNQIERLNEERAVTLTDRTEAKAGPAPEPVPERVQAPVIEPQPAAEPEPMANPEPAPVTDSAPLIESVPVTEPAGESNAEEENAQNNPEKKKKGKLRETINFFIPIVAAAIIATVIKTFIIANAVVPTGSMIPTINEKDRIIASRLSYKNNDPERYDIIMFSYPDNEDTTFVKRVLGLPGETISVVNGKVYITGKSGDRFEADDSFVNNSEAPRGSSGPFYIPELGEKITTDGSYCYAENGMNVGSTSFLSKYCKQESNGEYTVSEKLYFAIGDNINYSMDSRAWVNKYVAESKILGKVIFKYYPKFEKFE